MEAALGIGQKMALDSVVYTPLPILNIFFHLSTYANAMIASSWKYQFSLRDVQISLSY